MNLEEFKKSFKHKLLEYQLVLEQLDQIIRSTNEHLEGNSFYLDGQHGNLTDVFDTKRLNLFYHAMNSKNILEIGFNGGHSCLLFLIANPESKIQLFDIGSHTYARKCFEYLNTIFPGRLNIIWGDSTKTLQDFDSNIKYDFLHIDGGHQENVLLSDIENCKRLANENSIVIIDDISFHPDHMIKHLTRIVVDKLCEGEILLEKSPFFCNFHIAIKFNYEK